MFQAITSKAEPREGNERRAVREWKGEGERNGHPSLFGLPVLSLPLHWNTHQHGWDGGGSLPRPGGGQGKPDRGMDGWEEKTACDAVDGGERQKKRQQMAEYLEKNKKNKEADHQASSPSSDVDFPQYSHSTALIVVCICTVKVQSGTARS